MQEPCKVFSGKYSTATVGSNAENQFGIFQEVTINATLSNQVKPAEKRSKCLFPRSISQLSLPICTVCPLLVFHRAASCNSLSAPNPTGLRRHGRPCHRSRTVSLVGSSNVQRFLKDQVGDKMVPTFQMYECLGARDELIWFYLRFTVNKFTVNKFTLTVKEVFSRGVAKVTKQCGHS